MSVAVYNFSGTKQSGSVTLPKAKELKPATISLVVQNVLANEDRQRALTKTRGNVSGGGKKPWRQKGTGRARAGSIRSPLWPGGGIIFGPSGAKRALKQTPRKLRQATLASVLAQRADKGNLVVLTGKADLTRTKAAAQVMGKLGLTGGSVLVVTENELSGVIGCRNLADIEVTTTADFNLADVMRHANLIASKDALDELTGAKPRPAPKTAPTKTKSAVKKETP